MKINTKQKVIDILIDRNKVDILRKLKEQFEKEDVLEKFLSRDYAEETIRIYDMLIGGFDFHTNETDNAIYDIVSDIFRHFTGDIE